MERYREILGRRRAPFSPTLAADTEAGQMRYARAVAAVRQAEASLDSFVRATMEANAQTGVDLPAETRALLKLDCVSVVKATKEAIDIAVAVAGMGSSILATQDITQHYLRDFNAIIDHLTLDQDAMHTRAGQILLGRASGVEAALIFI